MKVCHITSVHSRYDLRILYKECISLHKAGYDVFLVVNDKRQNEIIDGVKIISTGKEASNRISRMINSVNWVYREAVKIGADVYHLHDHDDRDGLP